MCGIAGIISGYEAGFTDNELGLQWQNMLVNMARGLDSTGMFSVHANENVVQHRKLVGNAMDFYRHPDYQAYRAHLLRNGLVCIGHGRAATKGSVTVDNAHPFRVKYENDDQHEIIMVHNGTLDHWQRLPDFHSFQVDSHWLAHCLMKYGPEKALSEIDGAMAIVWVDTKTRMLNFFRNDERPLHYAEVRVGKAVTTLINSEQHALRWIMARNALQSAHKSDVFYFTPMKIYSIPVDDLGQPFKVTATIKKVEKRSSYYERPPVVIIGEKAKPVSTAWDQEVEEHWRKWYGSIIETEDNKPQAPDKVERVVQFPSGKAVQPVRTPKTLENRSYSSDVHSIMNGVYQYVEWEPANKIRRTKLATGALWIEKGDLVAPYEQFLVKLEPSPDREKWLRRHFNAANGTSWWEEKYINVDFVKEIATSDRPEKKEEPEQKEETLDEGSKSGISTVKFGYATFINPARLKRFRPGKKFQFHSRDGADTVINHSARIKQGVVLSEYQNNFDGEVSENEIVHLETYDIEGLASGLWKVIATRLRPGGGMDRAVEYTWYVPNEAEAELALRMSFYTGRVARISLASLEQYDKAGNYIEVIVDNVVISEGKEVKGAA